MIVACQAATMFCVLRWTFGAIEAIGLILFVGFSVDYTLHVAEAFHHAPMPKVENALHHVWLGRRLGGLHHDGLGVLPVLLHCAGLREVRRRNHLEQRLELALRARLLPRAADDSPCQVPRGSVRAVRGSGSRAGRGQSHGRRTRWGRMGCTLAGADRMGCTLAGGDRMGCTLAGGDRMGCTFAGGDN